MLYHRSGDLALSALFDRVKICDQSKIDPYKRKQVWQII